MTHQKLESYLQKKLADLDKRTDMQDTIYKGRFSFGIDETTYGHLPAWKAVVRQKKIMLRSIWITAFTEALLAVVVLTDFSEKFGQNWIKALAGLLLLSGLMMLFYFIGAFYSLFVQFRQTEREVRRLIYQDILFQLKEEKELA